MRVSSGIAGLDAVLNGGFLPGRTTVVSGATGSGKTVLASQFLAVGAVEHQEVGLMILFEESTAAVKEHFPGGWAAPGDGPTAVHFIDGRLPEDTVQSGTFDLGGLIAIAASLVKKYDVKRVAIDGIDAIFETAAEPHVRKREIVRVLDWLSLAGLTSVLTIKTDGREQAPDYFDLVEYAADGVLALHSTMIGELLRRTVRVMKMRGSGFIPGGHPYTISTHGLRVLDTPLRPTWIAQPLDARVSTGVERLDVMLQGGYRVGTTTLVSGTPGSAKTSLAAAFLAAGVRAGERCVYVGFDEPAEQMVADAHSIGIDLDGAVEAGLLCVDAYSPGSLIAEEHYLAIERLIEAHKPQRVVVDPVSALDKAGGHEIGEVIRERLVALLKSRGITALFTANADASVEEYDAGNARVSIVCDAWVQVGITNQDGERNRTLAVLKARGTDHSNQIRELLLSPAGIDLADVYTSPGDVLSGTARVQREQQIAAQRELESDRISNDLAALDRDRERLSRALQEASLGLDQIAADRASLVKRVKSSGQARARDTGEIRSLRNGDPEPE
jgi:circadian clock protein KaiC